jgi:nucleoside-diphosphate-sugar epimerase
MILLTGGTGFIGAYLLKQLIQKNYNVTAIHRQNNFPDFIDPSIIQKVNWIPGDVLDPLVLESAMENADTVIHSAAKVSFHKKDHASMLKINHEGTANVVNAAIEKNIRRFVHISSVAAIGRTSDGSAVNEHKKWEANKASTTYAISKYLGEMEVWRGIGEGLNAVIVNPTTVLGYGDWNQSSAGIFKSAWNEMPWYTSGINGFVDVEDVARATILLMESNYNSERFIINGDNMPFREVYNQIAHGLGKRPPYRRAGKWMASFAWRIAHIQSLISGRPALLTRESARVARSRTYFENKKILAALPGFAFTPLELTIKHACSQYLTKLQATNWQ